MVQKVLIFYCPPVRPFCRNNADRYPQQEFAALDDEANIYKLIGPVLVKQDKSEATMNVDKRLEFIGSEMYV